MTGVPCSRRRRAVALLLVLGCVAVISAQSRLWDDLPAAIQRRLTAMRLVEGAFGGFVADHARRTAERVRESDWDAIVYYALQSTAFTTDPPIEPAVDAKAFFEALGEGDRVR